MKYTTIIILILILNNTTAQVAQKRRPPKEVQPFIFGNIKYTAPLDEMGFIVARNVKTDSVIWVKQIYKIKYVKNMEIDVQDVYIATLTLEKDSLIIQTENNKTYKLKLNE